jgi:hypothetical protein
MKKKIYFNIMLVTYLSIATPIMASTPMFGESSEFLAKFIQAKMAIVIKILDLQNIFYGLNMML